MQNSRKWKHAIMNDGSHKGTIAVCALLPAFVRVVVDFVVLKHNQFLSAQSQLCWNEMHDEDGPVLWPELLFFVQKVKSWFSWGCNINLLTTFMLGKRKCRLQCSVFWTRSLLCWKEQQTASEREASENEIRQTNGSRDGSGLSRKEWRWCRKQF